MEKVRIGLIGCGAIARTHVDAIRKSARAELRQVCDVDAEAVSRMAGVAGCKGTTHAAEVFSDPAVDVVLICTPPAFHHDLIRSALGSGKHVLCEKPFTISLAQALEIRDLAARSGKLVEMASKFRFVKDILEAKKIISSGAIGEVVLAEVIFCSIVDMQRRWNSDPALSGGGVLIDNGSHAVDVLRYLLGPIESVYAQVGQRTQPLSVEDTARLHFQTTKGVIGMVDLSWSLYKNTDIYVNIFGTSGTIEVGWKRSVVWNSKERTSRVFGDGYNKFDAFVRQIEHFADCVQKKAEPILGIDDAVESVRVIENAYTSIREKRWLKFAP